MVLTTGGGCITSNVTYEKHTHFIYLTSNLWWQEGSNLLVLFAVPPMERGSLQYVKGRAAIAEV